MKTPRIAITVGEPAGIGPDIVLAMAQEAWDAELVAICDPQLLRDRARQLQLNIDLLPVDLGQQATSHQPGSLRIQAIEMVVPCIAGQLDTRNANYVLATLQAAIDGCVAGDYAAMVTAPVQKSVINDAAIPFSGHTEFLAHATKTNRVVMMLATQELRVALATTHLALKDVPAAITPELLETALNIMHKSLVEQFGIPLPTIAVLGLNPHAGEGGHMGREEIDTIIPTLNILRGRGLQLLGPLPADTAFNPKVLQDCDAVLAMYHDQGLPVLKYAGFGRAINITLGLPIIRTSVDHGTALDLAGSGSADAGSLREALTAAIDMSVAHRSN